MMAYAGGRMAKAKKSSKEPAPVTPVPQTQTVVVLGVAAKEGRADLTPGQYVHMSDLIRQLVFFGSRAYEIELRIEKFGDFWELKDKGGVLGKKNMRVYFAFNPETNEVVVLKTYKKEDDGSPPPSLKVGLRNRYREYLRGALNDHLIRYRRRD